MAGAWYRELLGASPSEFSELVDAFELVVDERKLLMPYLGPDVVAGPVRKRFRSGGKKWALGSKVKGLAYGVHGLWRERPLVVVEGESDVHACYLAGWFQVVGIPGSKMFDPRHKHVEYIRSLGIRELIVWEEPDQGGADLVRSVRKSSFAVKVIRPSEGRAGDLRELVTSFGASRRDEAYRAIAGLVESAEPVSSLPGEDIVLHNVVGAFDKGRSASSPSSGGRGYGHAALAGALSDIRRAGVGERNKMLAAKAFKLGALVRSGHLPEDIRYLVDAMVDASALPKREARYCARKGIAKGIAKGRAA